MKKIIGTVTKEEKDSLDLIVTKISTATQALSIIPQGTKEEKEFYIITVLDTLSNYRWLEKDWWMQILSKYGYSLKDNVHVDFSTGELYIYE